MTIKLFKVEVDRELSDVKFGSHNTLAKNEAEAIMNIATLMNWNQCLLKATEIREFASTAEARRFIHNSNITK